MKQFFIALLFCIALNLNAQTIEKQILYFDTDKWQLTASHKQTLDALIKKVSDAPSIKSIAVHGHTDFIGDSLYNIHLSERRSNSVANYLKQNSQGLNFSVRFFGENNPVADNTTPENRALNRRVEITFSTDETIGDPYISSIEELYRLIAPPAEEFCISNNRDTLIVGKQGTMLYIKANTFDVPDGFTDCIKITLKERYKKSDIVRDNLSTLTHDNQIIISQSMFEIDADRPLTPGNHITTFVPADTIIPDMEIFNGERDNDSIMRWTQDNSQDLFDIPGSVLNDLINSECTKDTLIIRELDTKCPLFFCRIFNGLGIREFTPERDTIVETIEVPCDTVEFIDGLGFMFIDQFRNIPIDADNYYVFQLFNMGWFNLDWMMKYGNRINYKVFIEPDKDLNVIKVYKKYRSVVPLSPLSRHYHFQGAPKGLEIWVIAIQVKNGDAYIAIEETTIDDAGFKDLKLNPVTLEEIKELLLSID